MNKAYRIFATYIVLFWIPILYAQPDLSGKISLQLSDASLEEAVQAISKKAGIEFSYNPRKIDLSERVSIEVENQNISDVLDSLCRQVEIEYLIVEDHIVLKPVRKSTIGIPAGPFHYTLSGYIRDVASNEVLIGATVYVAELEKGTISNEFGYYSLTLPMGLYDLQYSYIGYKTFQWQTNLVADVFYDIQMDEKSSLLEEVVITTHENQIDLTTTRTGNLNLAPRTVQSIPAFFGEQDVIKSLDAIPGISLQGDGSTLFFVRGGNKDQNLILLDDAPIYNPAHFLGLFSTFIPEAVKDINIYKGDIPAEYGGRLSSLIDVRTKDGDMNKYNVNGNLGLVAWKASVEGPVSKGKSSFFISGRSSYIKWYLKSQSQDIQKFNFYDINTKFNFRLGLKDRLHLSGYAGQDYFSQGNSPSNAAGISWSNIAGTLRWNHIFNDRLFSNTTLYSSKYDYFLILNVQNNDAWHSNISNVTLKSDFTWFANPDMNLRFGGKISRHDFNPGNLELGANLTNPFLSLVSLKSARETVLYISNNHTINPKFTIRYGLRFSTWTNIGQATEYNYDYNIIVNDFIPVDTSNYIKGEKYNTYTNIEPRIGMTYQVSATTSLKSSYTRTAQYLQLITNSISPFTTLEVWLPSGPQIKPQKGDQISLGYFKKFPEGDIDLSLEGFYKKLHNQIDYEDHAYMLLNPHIEKELRYGSGKAFGFEIFLKKYQGRLNGWIGYSYSRTERTIEGINNNEVYPASWDRPHDLSCFISYDVSERWKISANWIYMTGSTFSSPTAFYRYNGYTVPIYGKKNNDRLPDYHRLDLSTEIQLNKRERRYEHSLRFSIYNLYGRKNPFAVNFNKTLNPGGTPVVPGNLYLPPELVPSQMYLFQMVPSVSYSFKIK
jgi:hypothetical protein